MKIRTNTKAGGFKWNHSEALARGLKVNTGTKAGRGGPIGYNHSETLARGLKAKTRVKAGLPAVQ